jgi:hypothetical protein
MKVYLIPDEDATYVSCVSDDAPSNDAIFMVEEGPYPVESWYKRHDLNMDSLLMTQEIHSREDLIKHLDFQGKCRNEIVHLWDFYTYDNSLVQLHRLFDKCFDRKVELITEEMFEVCDDSEDEDVDDSDSEIITKPDSNLPF